jgi:O-antigen ligase
MGDLHTHNTHLEILVETGIVGFLAYLWLLVAIFLSAWKNRKRATGNQKVLLVGLMIASFTLLIQATFVSVEFEPVLWGTWGMLAGTIDRIKRGFA